MALKLKDKKLIFELFNNSKQSNRQLAKNIGISKETIANRIEFLKKNQYIKDFSCKINYNQLGFQEYNLFIRLKNISQSQIQNFISFLEKLDNSTWIGKSFGKYDIKLAIITKNNNINKIINLISQKFPTEIDTIDYLLVTDKYKASSKIFLKNLIGLNNPKIELKLTNNNPKHQITQIDKQIIHKIGQNPKITLIELSKILDITIDQAKYKIKKLEINNIITGYSIVLNGNKFNKIWCLVLLNLDIANISDFKEYLKKQEFLSSYNETLGIWNFNVTFFANNIEELYFNLNKIRTKFSQDIKNFEFLIFFEIYKYPKAPKCILK